MYDIFVTHDNFATGWIAGIVTCLAVLLPGLFVLARLLYQQRKRMNALEADIVIIQAAVDATTDFDKFQTECLDTVMYGPGDPLYLAAKLCGESGEVAEKVAKTIRDNDGNFDPAIQRSIAIECGDVLWYVVMIATSMGHSLRDAAILNVKKRRERRARGTTHGSGDNR